MITNKLLDKREKIMIWAKIKQHYPDKFILLGNIVEEEISLNKFKILEADVLKVSDNPIEIRKAYQEYTNKGKNVLYSIPNISSEFIVENVPVKGIFR